MTMDASKQAKPTSGQRKAFGIITVRGLVLDLSDSLIARPTSSSVTWRAHPAGPLSGLTAARDEHEASISWAPTSNVLRETNTEDAPDELLAHVRQTYLTYLELCLRLGEFQLEATPVTDAAENITGTSLRARLVERGAVWLDELPTADQQRFAPIPRADEVTMVDVPDRASPQTAPGDEQRPGEPT